MRQLISLAAFLFACASCALAADSSGFIRFSDVQGAPYKVSYDYRSLFVNGERSLFLSGSIHYPRSTPDMWNYILEQAAADGLNMVEIYTFWNFHQPVESVFDFSGRANLTQFLDLAAANNLFVNLRVGPYVCAEWDYGGIPAWVGLQNGLQFRTNNTLWMTAMQDWLQLLVGQVRNYFADMGGPIILAQIENELHDAPQEYVDWCGKLSQQLNPNVPWIMCNGQSAEETINSCNANDCVDFMDSHGQSGRILIDQPAIWTENEGWFQVWGDPYPDGLHDQWKSRAPSDIAYTVARFMARGGAVHNYYMWHGGNHYGRFAGSGLTTFYADDVNMHGDALPNEFKKAHLSNLHFLIQRYAPALVNNAPQYNQSIPLLWYNNETHSFQPGSQQLAFSYILKSSPADSVTFIENQASVYVGTLFNGTVFNMPPQSMSIVDSSNTELWNSAKVPAPTIQRQNTTANLPPFQWNFWSEPIGVTPADLPISEKLLVDPIVRSTDQAADQLSITLDQTMYMWYQTSFYWSDASVSPANVTIQGAKANAYMVFVDGQFACTMEDHQHDDGTLQLSAVSTLPLSTGAHTLAILSSTIGVDNGMGAGSVAKLKGITGSVQYGGVPVNSQPWLMRAYTAGEISEIYTPQGSPSVPWRPVSSDVAPCTWLQTTFATPPLPSSGFFSVLVDLTGMGRGEAYINSNSIGRYFLIEAQETGQPTQFLYHIPTDWLWSNGQLNYFTLFEELGASQTALSSVRLVISQMVPVSAE